MTEPKPSISQRFRGYFPVIIDVETGGFNAATDALLEVAAVTLDMDDEGLLHRDATIAFNVEPFAGANIEQAALDFTGIKPDCALRKAVPEKDALNDIFSAVRKKLKSYDCKRAVLVGHNAHFDLGFLHNAAERAGRRDHQREHSS